MPPRKRNESEFGSLMRSYGLYAHKWRDRGYARCPRCHRVLSTCPYCRQDMLMPKAETKPDFLVAMTYVYVEAKEGGDRWPFTVSITPNQRKVMLEHESYLFLEMGTGSAPNGRQAFLVPWEVWTHLEDNLLNNDIKSLVFEKTTKKSMTAKEAFTPYELLWKPNVGWTIPEWHCFRKKYELEERSDDDS